MQQIISVAAQLQNGKTTVVDYLSSKLGWQRAAFAHKVKGIFCDAFNVDRDFIEKWKVIKEPPPGFSKPVRQSLQFIGDGFREIMPTVWVDNCFNQYEPPMCIEDGRYLNELIKVAEKGGYSVLLWRTDFENDDPNGSEAQIRPVVDYFRNLTIDGVPFEGSTGVIKDWSNAPHGAKNINFFLRNDGSMNDLYRKIDEMLLPDLKARGYIDC